MLSVFVCNGGRKEPSLAGFLSAFVCNCSQYSCVSTPAPGLSPRAWGRACNFAPSGTKRRFIPACVGEGMTDGFLWYVIRVYPRVRGGGASPVAATGSIYSGLSPRVGEGFPGSASRVKRLVYPRARAPQCRPIGQRLVYSARFLRLEPGGGGPGLPPEGKGRGRRSSGECLSGFAFGSSLQRWCWPSLCARGGGWLGPEPRPPTLGLFPRVWGKECMGTLLFQIQRFIPARVGESAWGFIYARSSLQRWCCLSPCARGKVGLVLRRAVPVDLSPRVRASLLALVCDWWVYPRARGRADEGCAGMDCDLGLSPRVGEPASGV